MRRLVPVLFVAVFAAALVAAPVPKGGEEKLAPPTREQLKQSKNMKLIVLAMHNYLDANNTFPQDVTDANGKPILSWRVQLLPYLEKDEVYKKFSLDEPWDSATNKKLIEAIPDVYAPVRVKVKNKGETFYQGFVGNGALFEPGQRVGIAGITDGTSNTIAVVEAGEPVFWTKPGDLPFDPNAGLPKLGGQFDGDFYVGLCDGSVQFAYGTGMNADEFKKLITRAGGEIADADKAFGNGPKK
jgi:hypothetical protein